MMYKVLLVDDEPMIIEGLKYLINWENYGLVIAAQASNGLQAIEVLERETIHVVVTDIKMPDMNGLELIKYMANKSLQAKCIVLSGYDDFEYVRETIKLGIENYLLKPVDVEELIPTLQSTVEKIENEFKTTREEQQVKHVFRENIYRRWVTGNIVESELLDRSALLDVQLTNTDYCIALMKLLPERQDRKFHTEHDKDLIRFAIKNICSQIMNEQTSGICFLDYNEDIVLLFTINDSSNEKKLRSLLNECQLRINTLLHIDVFATVGNWETSYLNIHRSYTRAKNLQEFSLIYSHNKIVYSDELDVTDKQGNRVVQIDIQAIKGCLNEKNRQSSYDFIDHIYAEASQINGITPVFIQNTSLELLILSSSTIRELKPQADEFLSHFSDLFTHVFKLQTIPDLAQWMKGIIGRFIDYLEEEEEKMSPIVKNLIGYAQTHYAKDLNLTLIAMEFNVNTTYLGQLFKNETGYTFSNYLNMIRINKAKHLLSNSHLKVFEVAQEVGYVYTNYFCNIFKKQTGLTPAEYGKAYNSVIEGDVRK